MIKHFVISVLLTTGILRSSGQVLSVDSIFLERFIQNENAYKKIPLSKFYILGQTRFIDSTERFNREDLKAKFLDSKSKKDRLQLNDSLQKLTSFRNYITDEDKSMLIIEMLGMDLPEGSWQKYTPGYFSLAIELSNSDSVVVLDSLMLIRNYYYTNYSCGYNSTGKLSGILEWKKINRDSIVINGDIEIGHYLPCSKHRLVFSNIKMKVVTINDIIELDEEKKKAQENEIRNFKPGLDTSDVFTQTDLEFYDCYYNKKKYPHNRIRLHEGIIELVKIAAHDSMVYRKRFYKSMLIKPRRSFILENVNISNYQSDSLEVLSGNIFPQDSEKNYVINLHFFDAGKIRCHDDETDYSLQIPLIDLKEDKEYLFATDSQPEVRFSHWHFGPGTLRVIAEEYNGIVRINKIKKNVLYGFLKLNFSSPMRYQSYNREIAILHGKFQLPIINTDQLKQLEKKMRVTRKRKANK